MNEHHSKPPMSDLKDHKDHEEALCLVESKEESFKVEVLEDNIIHRGKSIDIIDTDDDVLYCFVCNDTVNFSGVNYDWA